MGRVGCVNQSTPGALADEHSNFAVPEHVRHQVSARPGHLVNDHYLRTPDTSSRAGEGITIAGNVVEVAVKVALQNVYDVVSRRAAAVETLVDDHAFFVLLREVVTIETGIAGLAGVRKIDVGKLAVGEFIDQTSIRLDPSARA